MTFKEWQYDLKCLLRGMPRKEIKAITDYYEEMYTDKKEAGIPELEILMEFGSPDECAEKIRKESTDGDEQKKPRASAVKEERTASSRPPLAFTVIGMCFLTLLVLIPLAAVLIGAIASFAATSIAGAASAIAGVCAIAVGIVHLCIGMGLASSLAAIGGGIALCGAGTILAVSFFVITKYSAVATYKATLYVFRGRKEK